MKCNQMRSDLSFLWHFLVAFWAVFHFSVSLYSDQTGLNQLLWTDVTLMILENALKLNLTQYLSLWSNIETLRILM